MQILFDPHTHTVASGHAYNTRAEMIHAAKEKGFEGLGITEHGPALPGSCHAFYFSNLHVIDRKQYGIQTLYGIEVNIMNEDGELDVNEELLEPLDLVIASFHPPCYSGNRDKTSIMSACKVVMENPYVNIIGHPDDERFVMDYDLLARMAKETGTLLELNNTSLSPGGFRVGCYSCDKEMLLACMKYGTKIVVSSDAHVDTGVGNYKAAIALLEELEFPEELVANRTLASFISSLK